MNARVFGATAPAGIAMLVSSCAALSWLILSWNLDISRAVWGLLALSALGLLAVWPAAWSGRITWERTDQIAWAVLICHTLQFIPGRDPAILLKDQTPTSIVMFQVGVWCVCLAYAGVRLICHLDRFSNLWGPAGRYATLFFLAAVSSATYAASPIITLAWALKLLTILALASLMFDGRDPVASCEKFLRATYMGLVLMLLLFLYLGAVDPESAAERSNYTGIWRLGGFLLSATKLSGVGGLVALLALVDMLSRRMTRRSKVIFALSILMMAASLGRGGMLATGVSMVIVLLMFRKLRHAIALACLVGVLFLAAPGLMDFSWEVLSRRQGVDQIASLTGRVPLWQTATDLIFEQPLLGWGYVSGSRVGLISAFRLWPALDAHNALLQILLTLGLVGTLITLLLLVRTIGPVVSQLRASWDPRAVDRLSLASVKILALLVFLIVQGLLEAGFAGVPKFETAILIGCAMCADQIRRASRAPA